MANSLKDRMSQREAALHSTKNSAKKPSKSIETKPIKSDESSPDFVSDIDSEVIEAPAKKKTPNSKLQQLKKSIEEKKEDVSGIQFHPFRQNKKANLKDSMKKRAELSKAKKNDDEDSEQIVPEARSSLLKESKEDGLFNKKDRAKKADELQRELKQKQEERYEKELSARTLEKSKRKTNREKSNVRFKKGLSIFLVVLSVYMLFLTFGIINTDYIYNDKNEVVPKRVSLSEINELKSFQALATQYYACRSVYEEVLMFDYRYQNAENHESLVLLSSDYWKVTDKMKNIGVQINALKLPSEYTNVKNQLLTWTSEYMYWYCQRMSYSITDNSVEDFNEAVELQKSVYSGFRIISTNLASLGLAVPGAEADVEDISSWSPEKYIDEQTGGLY